MTSEVERLIRTLGLSPHPEGGYYAETFRAPSSVTTPYLEGTRSASTAIYFLLTSLDFSAFHCVLSDEVWHHYAGDPLALYLLDTQGDLQCVTLGREFEHGQRPQAVAAKNVLQAARVLPGPHGYTLCGCTVSPGFDFRDFSMPERAELLQRHPAHADVIRSLTR